MASGSDDFNRSNGALGANWTAVNAGSWAISSNAAVQTSAGGQYRAARWAGTQPATNNYYARVTARSSSGSTGAGLLIRATTTGTAAADVDGYAVVFFPGDQFYLVRIDNGDDGGIGYGYAWGSPASNTDYLIEIEADGTTITVSIDGTERITVADSTYTAGAVALLTYGPGATFDNFTFSDLATGITGSGAATLAAITAAGAGTVASTGIAGAGAATLAAITAAGAGTIPISAAGAATLDAVGVQSQRSIRFYGNGTSRIDRIVIPLEDGGEATAANVGAANFTYEARIKCTYANNASTATDEDARYSNIIFDRDIWGHPRGHVFGVTRSGSNLVACFGLAGAGLSWATIFTTSNIGDGNWHHIAITRNATTGAVTIWIDGTQEAAGTYDTNDWSWIVGYDPGAGQDNDAIVLGTEKHDVGYGYNGEIDNLRISNSIRYSATFTPPTRHDPDPNTAALYRFDDASGTTAADAATITGAPTDGSLLVGGSPAGPIWVSVPHGAVASTAIGGSGAATLDNATAAGAGIVPITAAGAATAADVQAAGAGIVPITAAGAATLDAIATAGAGIVPITAAGSGQIDAVQAAGAGIVPITAESSAATLEAITAAGGATISIMAAGAATAADVQAAGAGIVPITAAGAATLDAIATAGAGAIPITGAGGATVADVTAAGTGATNYTGIGGSGSGQIDAVTAAGAGSIPITAESSAAALEATTTAGGGQIWIVGSGAATLADVATAGSGAIDYNGIGGSGAAVLDNATAAGAGTIPITAAGAATAADVQAAGAGIVPITAAGAATLAAITASAAGIVPIVAAGGGQVDAVTAAGTGGAYDPIAGAGAATLADVTAVGAGYIGIAEIIFIIGTVTGGRTTGIAAGGRAAGSATGNHSTGAVKLRGRIG